MTIKMVLEQESAAKSNSKKSNYSKPNARKISPSSFYSPKLSIYLLAICVVLFILFHIQALHTLSSPSPSPSSSPNPSWTLMQQWQKTLINTTLPSFNGCTQELKSMAAKLRKAVTFLPLKDLRYSTTALQGHTWFMSSMYDTREDGEVQYQKYPSNASNGRLLCLKGNDTHDGSWNSYALAWPETLPFNATLMKGLTFISYNHYNYDNIWHGLSAMVPFVAWHIKNDCELPTRWILYHWGELRTKMGPWLRNVMEATFGGPLCIEGGDELGGRGGSGGGDDGDDYIPVCFEDAVVMRHNEGGMGRERRLEVYDLLRCKTRMYCNVSLEGRLGDVDEKGLPIIGLTLFMRTGPRSFKNESAVVDIFDRQCKKVEGCRLTVAYSNNLTFCEQVKLMSSTDILVSPHGAQLTNMFLMDRNSSVMEFFPKGWLKLAGVGQFVYHWIASWSGMKHEGAWRDPNGYDECPFPEDDRRCMSIYKNRKIGFNETYFSQWSSNVLNDVKMRKFEEVLRKNDTSRIFNGCACS